MIKELIVVEGKNDAHLLRRALGNVEILWTEGYGLTEKKMQYIARAAEGQGVIILTDPDTPGGQIRERIRRRVPKAKHVYLSKQLALKDGDVGVENASLEEIRRVFSQVRTEAKVATKNLTDADMFIYGLTGTVNASVKRQMLGRRLGLGDMNAKQFIMRLNRFGISRNELEQALEELDDGKCI